MNCVNVN